MRRDRWADVTFTPATGTVIATRQRGVVHHRDPATMIFLPLFAAGSAAAIWINRSAPVPTLLILTGGLTPWLVGLYLHGLSLKVTVTPARVVVHERFTRYDIPRHLVTGLTTRPDGDLNLTITGHLPVIITAGAFYGAYIGGRSYAHDRPPQIRTARQLDRLLRAVPAGPNTGATVTIRPRIASRVLATVAAGCFLAAITAAPFSLPTKPR